MKALSNITWCVRYFSIYRSVDEWLRCGLQQPSALLGRSITDDVSHYVTHRYAAAAAVAVSASALHAPQPLRYSQVCYSDGDGISDSDWDRVGTGEWSGRPLAIPPSSFIFLVISLKLSHPTAKDKKQSCSSVHVLFNPVNALMHAGCCMILVDNKIWKIRFCAPDTPTIQTLFIYHCSWSALPNTSK